MNNDTIGDTGDLRGAVQAGRIRTSATHPLRIDVVRVPGSSGSIGITFCPGKRGSSVHGARWQRDLDVDLDAIAAWNPRAMVTLIEQHEFELLGVTRLGAMVSQRGIDWHHMPIVDVQPPGKRFELAWLISGAVLLKALRDGERVLVHCRGGLGRAGTVAARLLVELGSTPEEAIRLVRAVRPGAIETGAQQCYVSSLATRTRLAGA